MERVNLAGVEPPVGEKELVKEEVGLDPGGGGLGGTRAAGEKR